MTPEEVQQARLRAMALRGDHLEQQTSQNREADILSGLGASLSGFGDRAIDGTSEQMIRRGDALRQLAQRRQGYEKTPEELENLSALAAERRRKTELLGQPKPAKDTSFGDTTGLRKELSSLPETKALGDVENQFAQMSGAANNATGDVARIMALARIYEPGGRVTDSDYTAAKQGQGPMARFQGAIHELEGSGTLSNQTRKNMLEMARKLYEKRKSDYAARAETFKEIATGRGLKPEHVVIRPGSAADPAPVAGGDFDLEQAPQPATEAEYKALPRGQIYRGKDGKPRRKK